MNQVDKEIDEENGPLPEIYNGKNRKFWHTPRLVLQALAKSDKEKRRYEKEQILEWINFAAPMAASKLITQCHTGNDEISQKAAIAILQWCIGRPPQSVEGSQLFQNLSARKIEIIITDPSTKNDTREEPNVIPEESLGIIA